MQKGGNDTLPRANHKREGADFCMGAQVKLSKGRTKLPLWKSFERLSPLIKTNNMHYQEKLDELFNKGKFWKHRTMRTIFDPFSTEWADTSFDEKLDILKIIKGNDIDLQSLIIQYKRFYHEEGKTHVTKSVEDGLRMLLNHSLS